MINVIRGFRRIGDHIPCGSISRLRFFRRYERILSLSGKRTSEQARNLFREVDVGNIALLAGCTQRHLFTPCRTSVVMLASPELVDCRIIREQLKETIIAQDPAINKRGD